MIDFLQTVLALLVALSLLVAVHELGHFLVARWVGVKVLRFSIGFGKPLWQRRGGRDQTEYTIAAIPLGGYVKMLDEREGEVADGELHRAFNRQSLARRAAIVVAGPLFNFLFAIAAYWLMFVIGISGVKPLLGEVPSGSSAYAAGLRGGEEVIAVNGEATPTWQAVMETVLPHALLQEPLKLTVFDGGLTVEKELSTDELSANLQPAELFQRLGLQPYSPPIAPVLGEVVAGSVAERAGLKTGDLVVSAAQTPIREWRQLVAIISDHPGMPLQLVVLRGSEELTINLRPERVDSVKGPIGRIGAAVHIDEAQFDALRAEMRYGPVAAVTAAIKRTWEMSSLSLRMIGEMLVGRASVENLSGPIGIAQYAKRSAVAGISQFLAFLGLISVSLGVLNLLPIPVLDGGHLFFYLVELVKGKPVTPETEVFGQRIGLALILALMTLALYNDLVRLAG